MRCTVRKAMRRASVNRVEGATDARDAGGHRGEESPPSTASNAQESQESTAKGRDHETRKTKKPAPHRLVEPRVFSGLMSPPP